MSGIARRSGFLERDGERIYFEASGAGDALVLCHGMGGNHAIWYQQVAHFARTRRVVTFDHRGFGRSTDRAGLSGPEVAVGDLAALLDHLGAPRADVVGQSMGGWTALGLTRHAPGRVRRLVLADTLGGLSTSRIREVLERIRRAVGGRGPGAAQSDRLGLHPALDPAFTERDPARAHLYQMLGALGEPDLGKVLPRLMATRVGRGDVAGLDLPVLFVVGARDPLFPPAVVRAAAALLPDASVVEIPGCGHSPYFEDPAAWNEAVEAFLGGGAPATGA